ncbi:MAG: hypothetical protein ACLUI3_08900 [Christensenellales bacterium]
MKRALLAAAYGLRIIGVRAENVTMMTDVFGNERFSVVEEAALFALRSANRGMNGKPLGKRCDSA